MYIYIHYIIVTQCNSVYKVFENTITMNGICVDDSISSVEFQRFWLPAEEDICTSLVRIL